MKTLIDSVALLRTKVDRAKATQWHLVVSADKLRIKIKELQKELRQHEYALEILKEVGITTQRQFQYQISEIATLALSAVFPDPYELQAEFQIKRNKVECSLKFTRAGVQVDPLTEAGGGAVDVAAFALRIATYTMKHPRSRATVLLDEPMKNVSRDLQEKASQMIKEVSEKLGIQFVIVTHEPTLSEFADKTFKTTYRNKRTKVTEL